MTPAAPGANRLEILSAQIEAANQRIASNAAAIESATKRLATLETDVAGTRKTVDSGQVTLTSNEKRLAETEAQLTSARQSQAATTESVGGVGKRVDTIETSVSAAASRIDKLEAASGETRKALESALSTLETRLSGAEKEITANKRSDGDAAKLIAELQASLSALDKRLSGDEQSLAANGVADADTVKRVAAVEGGIKALGEQITQIQAENKEQTARIGSVEAALAAVSSTAKDALDRAIAAGKLAEGKLLFETVLTDQIAQFDFNKSTLSKAAKAELKVFADKIKSVNKNVFIEIQGHTDNVGSAANNLDLGQERADTVMAYLHNEFGIPLHRMSAMSYGESKPVADNKTKAGRAKNRRVVLVVLK
jgi:outer membrane protein OmpA-like peptidoglycan-associated protein